MCTSVPNENPGRASDVIMTTVTKIMQDVPFGSKVKVDKGFIVDNEAAAEGVKLDRPQLRKQKQVFYFSDEESWNTQSSPLSKIFRGKKEFVAWSFIV